MFDAETILKPTTIQVGPLVVMLQLLARTQTECRRFDGSSAIADHEFSTIGNSRDAIVRAIYDATGINYDGAMVEIRKAEKAAANLPVNEISEEKK